MTAFNSSAICRKYEAEQRLIAANATLPNVRNVALRAASAWAHEAQEAEALENGSGRNLSADDAKIALEFLLEDDSDIMGVPEDPDSDAAERRRA